jgi:hypothetical protein
MTGMTHHLTAHWMVDDHEGVGDHHHLMEVWVDEDEAPTAPSENQNLAEAA